MSGFFIAGTDTGVGKTFVSCALLTAWNHLGTRAMGFKPVAAGCEMLPEGWINEDIARLQAASWETLPVDKINTYLFREAIAPHIAAERKGVAMRIPAMVEAYQALAQDYDLVLVEGAGGFRVPLDDVHDMADLAMALKLPVILVVGMRLGCLNHALLTVESMAARGLTLAGWVANRIDPDMAVYDENLATLVRRIPAPLLLEIPWLDHGDHARAARLIPAKRLTGLLMTGR